MNIHGRKKRDETVLEARRFIAVKWFRRKESQSSIARRLEVSRQAVHKWWKAFHENGKKALYRRHRPGRPSKLTKKELKRIPGLLRKGSTAYGYQNAQWTTLRIADLIWEKFSVKYDRDHICRLMHKLGYSWQKPTRRAMERDEEGIARWKRTTWPRIKKKPRK